MNAVTGFRSVPPFAYGLVRDLRVRWALEEAGIAFESTPIDFADKTSDAFRQKNPFGLVPVFEADGRATFESGAILLQLAEESEVLMPTDKQGRADLHHKARTGRLFSKIGEAGNRHCGGA